eukprot:1158941-Amphidinium_carterae.1
MIMNFRGTGSIYGCKEPNEAKTTCRIQRSCRMQLVVPKLYQQRMAIIGGIPVVCSCIFLKFGNCFKLSVTQIGRTLKSANFKSARKSLLATTCIGKSFSLPELASVLLV